MWPCRKVPGLFYTSHLTDEELADQLASADVLVLATRTRSGRNPCGEGFGLVLLEAQVAGTPVIAPGHGGSHDAYIEGVTGMAPTDESVPALASVLRNMLGQPDRLAQMSKSAADWSRKCCAPGRTRSLQCAGCCNPDEGARTWFAGLPISLSTPRFTGCRCGGRLSARPVRSRPPSL